MTWTTTTIRPLGARIVVKLDPQAERYGVIEIPDDYRRQPQTGTVIAAGPGHRDAYGRLHPLDVKPGDRVVVGKWNGVPLTDPDDDDSGKPTPRYWLMEQAPHKKTKAIKIDDVYGVVEGEQEGTIPEWQTSKSR